MKWTQVELPTLPEFHSTLIKEIESAARLEIDVLPFSLTEHFIDQAEDDLNVACVFDKDRARIVVRDGYFVTSDDVLHELLHLHRWYVEKIPRLIGIPRIHLIDNHVEHSFMFPIEFREGEKSYTTYLQDYVDQWSNYEGLNWMAHWSERAAMFDAFYKTRTYFPEATSAATTALSSAGLLEKATSVSDALENSVDKVSYAQVLLLESGVSLSHVKIETFTRRGETPAVAPLSPTP